MALRHWRYHWAHQRVVIHVNMDNIASLSMLCRMQPHFPTQGVVARELALDIADAIYQPTLASHIPGIANVAADMLSRRYQPGVHYKLPRYLGNAQEVVPAKRDKGWWRSLSAGRLSQDGYEGPTSTPRHAPPPIQAPPKLATRIVHDANRNHWQDEFQ